MENVMQNESNVEDPAKQNLPKPTDFDKFVPWACKEFSIDTDVFVTRAAQRVYVGSGVQSKKGKSTKHLKQPSEVLADAGSDDELNSSFDKNMLDEDRIMIETYYDSNDELVQVKFLKNKKILRQVIQTIALTIPYHKFLTSITINSGLNMESLYELSKFIPISHITEICLDGTFLSKANYYILLTHANSNLKHLSLARCSINDAVVKTIADQLCDPSPASKVLSALNLSTNRITDTGAKYLADVLRTNRKLSYLNLASNTITDEGVVRILDTLQTFPLLAQELLESRARYVAYLKKRNTLISSLILELQTVKVDKTTKKKMSKKSKGDTQSLQQLASEKPLPEAAAEAQIIQEKAEYMAEKKLGLFDEPFSPNNTTTQNGVVYCFGNNTLCYLDLAYNHLTFVSLKKLNEVLLSQKSLNRTPKGLIKVVIEGNLMPVACKELDNINNLLASGTCGLKRYSEISIRKKPIYSKTSAR